MGIKNKTLLWTSLVGIVVSGGLLVAVGGYLALMVGLSIANGAPIIATLVDIAPPAIFGIGALLVVFGLSAVGLLWSFVQMASLPKSERLATLFDLAESHNSTVRSLGFADLLRPPQPTPEERTEQAIAELKQQYVNDEITEAEFEQKVNQLVGSERIDDTTTPRTRQETIETRQ